MNKTFETINDLYSDNKSRGFVNHLVKAYMPTSKITKVFDFDSVKQKKCCICSTKLISAAEIIQNLHKGMNDGNIQSEMSEMLKKYVNNESVGLKDNPMYNTVLKGKVLAWTGEKTSTGMCLSCAKEFVNFVESKILSGDKNMYFLISSLRKAAISNQFNSNYFNDDERKLSKDIKKNVKKSQIKKVSTLGDLDALQDLKKKMENNI